MAGKNMSSIFTSILKSVAGLIVGSSSNSVYNPKEDVEELRRMVVRIRATLDHEEERDVKYETKKLWLEELKDLAYDAEDIVDKYDFEVLRSKVEGQSNFRTTHKRKREESKVEGKNKMGTAQKRRREEERSLITPTVSVPDDFEDTTDEYDFKALQSKVDQGQNQIGTAHKRKREEVSVSEAMFHVLQCSRSPGSQEFVINYCERRERNIDINSTLLTLLRTKGASQKK